MFSVNGSARRLPPNGPSRSPRMTAGPIPVNITFLEKDVCSILKVAPWPESELNLPCDLRQRIDIQISKNGQVNKTSVWAHLCSSGNVSIDSELVKVSCEAFLKTSRVTASLISPSIVVSNGRVQKALTSRVVWWATPIRNSSFVYPYMSFDTKDFEVKLSKDPKACRWGMITMMCRPSSSEVGCVYPTCV